MLVPEHLSSILRVDLQYDSRSGYFSRKRRTSFSDHKDCIFGPDHYWCSQDKLLSSTFSIESQVVDLGAV